MAGTVTLKMIVAMTKCRGIGKSGGIPWYYSQDLKRFRKLTSGCPIIMGRTTWESLPKQPLPNRLNIILTRNPESIIPMCDGMAVATSPEEAIQLAKDYYQTQSTSNLSHSDTWVIGGQAVYETFIHSPLLSHIDCTIVPDDCECDTFFVQIPTRFVKVNTSETILSNCKLIHEQYSHHQA
jgi:dihydrofolate reductase